MTSQEIERGNRIIAEFMGESGKTKVASTGRPARDRYGAIIKDEYEVKLVPYVPSYEMLWQNLMPVIEKISLIEFDRKTDEETGEVTIWRHHPVTFGMLNSTTGRPMFRYSCSGLFEADTLIEAAYIATVDFLEWYNSQPK